MQLPTKEEEEEAEEEEEEKEESPGPPMNDVLACPSAGCSGSPRSTRATGSWTGCLASSAAAWRPPWTARVTPVSACGGWATCSG